MIYIFYIFLLLFHVSIFINKLFKKNTHIFFIQIDIKNSYYQNNNIFNYHNFDLVYFHLYNFNKIDKRLEYLEQNYFQQDFYYFINSIKLRYTFNKTNLYFIVNSKLEKDILYYYLNTLNIKIICLDDIINKSEIKDNNSDFKFKKFNKIIYNNDIVYNDIVLNIENKYLKFLKNYYYNNLKIHTKTFFTNIYTTNYKYEYFDVLKKYNINDSNNNSTNYNNNNKNGDLLDIILFKNKNYNHLMNKLLYEFDLIYNYNIKQGNIILYT